MKKIAVFILILTALSAFSQETKYHFIAGEIIKIENDTITLAVYDNKSGTVKNIVCTIDKNVNLIGLKSVKSLRITQYIEAEYIIINNKKVIHTILIE